MEPEPVAGAGRGAGAGGRVAAAGVGPATWRCCPAALLPCGGTGCGGSGAGIRAAGGAGVPTGPGGATATWGWGVGDGSGTGGVTGRLAGGGAVDSCSSARNPPTCGVSGSKRPWPRGRSRGAVPTASAASAAR
ncbi:hypothetical protein [Micromonospora sp. RL09-050-HVF-A]|uniref:hypothetical protein n=1 Tax=Micromonospora sp. RL09-050-HVF-A TaxID=1703433 RepID=UPI001C5D5A8A|nr:hypothetical protein [Micromonospora sp. RL09-050-HVF-A]MBW4700977.1 hypothetical protein [Micromonospora sp. RL09-050-HVF-A]